MTDETSGRRKGSPLDELEELYGRRGKTLEAEVPPAKEEPQETGAAIPLLPLGQRKTLGTVLGEIRHRRTGTASEAVAPIKAIPPRPGLGQLLIRFEAGDTFFAVPMKQVTEIGVRPPCTRVPRLPAFFPGVANIRGEIVLALDLSLYMHRDRVTAAKRSLLLHGEDQKELAVVLVDEIHGIAPFARDDIRPPTSATRHAFRNHELGAFEFKGRIYSVVDLLGLLQSLELRSHLGARL